LNYHRLGHLKEVNFHQEKMQAKKFLNYLFYPKSIKLLFLINNKKVKINPLFLETLNFKNKF